MCFSFPPSSHSPENKPPSPGGLHEETLLEMTGLGAAGYMGHDVSGELGGKHREAQGSTPTSGCPRGAPAQPMTSSDTAPSAGHAARPAP